MKRNMLLVFIVLIAFSQNAVAQCCSAGNPFFYGEQANLGHKELQVLAGYKYSFSDDYYNGTEKISIDFIDKAYFNYFNLQLMYGLTPRFSIQTDLGYFKNKTELYSNVNWKDSQGYGMGDATLIFRYLAYKNFTKKYSIIPSIGIKIPIGVFDQVVDNVKLPITVQPSSGSFRYLFNVYINKSFKNPKWNLGFFGSFEYAQLINSTNFYYKYGNLYLFSLLTSYKITKNINIGLELRSENRDRAERENEQVVESSGYQIVYAIPHLSYAFGEKWLVSLNAELPVYRYYNGIQLGNKFAFSARLSYQISFEKQNLKEIKIN